MSENTSDRPLNGWEDVAARVLGVPEILCTRFVRRFGNREIGQFSGSLSISNLIVFSADGGFDSRRLHQSTVPHFYDPISVTCFEIDRDAARVVLRNAHLRHGRTRLKSLRMHHPLLQVREGIWQRPRQIGPLREQFQ